jgi:hypothetical protein
VAGPQQVGEDEKSDGLQDDPVIAPNASLTFHNTLVHKSSPAASSTTRTS